MDWGRNPRSFQYETVTLNFYNDTVVADDTLHQSEGDEPQETGSFTIDGRQLTIYHRYDKPGVFYPIYRVQLEVVEYFSVSSYTCSYQMGDTLLFSPSGNRSDASCMTDSREVFVIDKFGGCTVSTLSSLKASTAIGVGSFVGVTITAALVLSAGFGLLANLRFRRKQMEKRDTGLLDI